MQGHQNWLLLDKSGFFQLLKIPHYFSTLQIGHFIVHCGTHNHATAMYFWWFILYCSINVALLVDHTVLQQYYSTFGGSYHIVSILVVQTVLQQHFSNFGGLHCTALYCCHFDSFYCILPQYKTFGCSCCIVAFLLVHTVLLQYW